MDFILLGDFILCLGLSAMRLGAHCVKGKPLTIPGDALSCRASPLEKQSTGLFFNSPLAERLCKGVSPSAEGDEGRCPLDPCKPLGKA
ncbi:MAG: hypothetical protein SOZ56_01905 [Oscillospiraceae bacterium]|nr:hypothetical protein [Oscillospiraceae bacterium]